MPRYFFSIFTGDVRLKNEGIELTDRGAAWKEATMACGEMIKDLDGSLKPGQAWIMTVSDTSDAKIFELKFATEEFFPHGR